MQMCVGLAIHSQLQPSGNYVLGRVITISDYCYLIKIINFIDITEHPV